MRMNFSIAARLVFSAFSFAILTRMVWLASCGTSVVARDHLDLVFDDLPQPERRRRPADIDLAGHHLRQRRRRAAGRDRLGAEPACFSSASRIRLDDEPGEEKATVLIAGLSGS